MGGKFLEIQSIRATGTIDAERYTVEQFCGQMLMLAIEKGSDTTYLAQGARSLDEAIMFFESVKKQNERLKIVSEVNKWGI
jgi:hypothetical protein